MWFQQYVHLGPCNEILPGILTNRQNLQGMLKSIIRGAGKVAVGTAVGQAVILLSTPFLARQYSPAEFGSLALLLTVSNIATALACIRYDLSVSTASKAEVSSLFWVAILSAAVSSFVVIVAIGMAGILQNSAWSSPFDNILLVGSCVLFVGIQQAVIGIMTHERSYAGLGALRFGQGGMFAVLAIFPSIGLLFAHAASFLVAVPFAVRRLVGIRVSVVEIGQAAYSRRDFPLVSLPGAVLDVIGYSACVWIMVYFYGATETGQFSQIQRIVGAPLMLLGMSVGQVLLRTSADAIEDRDYLTELFRKICFVVGLFGVVSIAILSIVGEPLLHWLIGSQWRVDVEFIVPIAIAVTIRACVSPLSALLISLRRFDLALRWQFTYFVSSVTVLTMSAIKFDFEKFIIVYAIHEIFLYALYLMLIAKAIRNVKCAESLV